MSVPQLASVVREGAAPAAVSRKPPPSSRGGQGFWTTGRQWGLVLILAGGVFIVLKFLGYEAGNRFQAPTIFVCSFIGVAFGLLLFVIGPGDSGRPAKGVR